MQPIRAQYWDKKAKQLVAQTVTTLDELELLANQLLSVATQGSLPGLELTSKNNGHSTLAVAVAPFGWALIHTASDHATQHCTYNPHGSEASVDVQWEEVTSVPRAWFITQDTALEGIRQWAANGALAAGLPWSDNCS